MQRFEKAGEGVELPLSLCALPTTLTLFTPDCANGPARALGGPRAFTGLGAPGAPLLARAVRNRALLAWDRVQRDQEWKRPGGAIGVGERRITGRGERSGRREAGPGKFTVAVEGWAGCQGAVKGWGGRGGCGRAVSGALHRRS